MLFCIHLLWRFWFLFLWMFSSATSSLGSTLGFLQGTSVGFGEFGFLGRNYQIVWFFLFLFWLLWLWLLFRHDEKDQERNASFQKERKQQQVRQDSSQGEDRSHIVHARSVTRQAQVIIYFHLAPTELEEKIRATSGNIAHCQPPNLAGLMTVTIYI